MEKNRPVLLMICLVIFAALVVACGGNAEPVVTPVPVVIATEIPPVVQGDVIATDEDAPELGAFGQPIDIPIIDVATELQISSSGENINYKIPSLTLQEVYDYYRGQLDVAGWIQGPNEVEIVVSRQITLARTNDAGDRVTIGMQHNPIGEFVIISIYITRAP